MRPQHVRMCISEQTTALAAAGMLQNLYFNKRRLENSYRAACAAKLLCSALSSSFQNAFPGTQDIQYSPPSLPPVGFQMQFFHLLRTPLSESTEMPSKAR